MIQYLNAIWVLKPFEYQTSKILFKAVSVIQIPTTFLSNERPRLVLWLKMQSLDTVHLWSISVIAKLWGTWYRWTSAWCLPKPIAWCGPTGTSWESGSSSWVQCNIPWSWWSLVWPLRSGGCHPWGWWTYQPSRNRWQRCSWPNCGSFLVKDPKRIKYWLYPYNLFVKRSVLSHVLLWWTTLHLGKTAC